MICVLLGPASDSGRRDRPIRTGRRDKPVMQLPSVALRVAIMVGIAVVLFAIILFRLWFLQILSGQQFVAQANDHRLHSLTIVAPRGSIVDRHGEALVENRPGLAVGMRLMDVPAGELDTEMVRLARVVHTRPAKLRKAIMDHLRPSWPPVTADNPPMTWADVVAQDIVGLDLAIVKEDVDKRDVSYILEHAQAFPGVEIQKNYLRSYPGGSLAAHVLGHVGEISAEQLEEKRFKGYSAGDVVGVEGLEWTYDRWLRGRDGVAKLEVDAHGRPTQSGPVPGGRLPEPGDTLVTTIDAKVQAKAEEALTYAIDLAHSDGRYRAAGGVLVVAADGGVFRFSDRRALGSFGAKPPKSLIAGVTPLIL